MPSMRPMTPVPTPKTLYKKRGRILITISLEMSMKKLVRLTALNNSEEWTMELGSTNPKGQEVLDRFVEASDYEFECSEIVGRKFENVADHADHLRAGGCSEIVSPSSIRTGRSTLRP